MVLTSRPRGKPLLATFRTSGHPGAGAAEAPGQSPPEKAGNLPAPPRKPLGQLSAKPSHRRRNATPSMTELKSYDLPELEALAEQIKAEIVKRELEEQERARQAAEAEAEAARQAQAAAEAAERAAAEKAAEASRKIAEKKEAAKKEAARKAAEKKAAAEAAKEAAQAAVKPVAAPTPAPAEVPHIRYMHPSNRALTWSGEGTMPDWISAWLVTGGTLYALEIAAEKLAPKPIPESFKPR